MFRCLHGLCNIKVPAEAIKREGSLLESLGGCLFAFNLA